MSSNNTNNQNINTVTEQQVELHMINKTVFDSNNDVQSIECHSFNNSDKNRLKRNVNLDMYYSSSSLLQTVSSVCSTHLFHLPTDILVNIIIHNFLHVSDTINLTITCKHAKTVTVHSSPTLDDDMYK